jgi:hypothetical protein
MQFCWKLRPLMRELPQIVESCFKRLRMNRIYIKIRQKLFSCTNGHFLPICTLIGLIIVTEEQILNYFTSEQFSSNEEENIFILSEPTSRPHKLSPASSSSSSISSSIFYSDRKQKERSDTILFISVTFLRAVFKAIFARPCPDNFKNRSPPKQSTTLGTLRW